MRFIGDLLAERFANNQDSGKYVFELIHDPSGQNLLGVKELDPSTIYFTFDADTNQKRWIQLIPGKSPEIFDFEKIVVILKKGDKWDADQRYIYLNI